MLRTLEFAVEYGDINSFDADVIALKYAQSFYGADLAVASAISPRQEEMERLCPGIGDYRYVKTYGRIRSQHALFVGVPPLHRFRYQQIREFASRVLEILANEAPNTRHVAMTIHGPGYGLDEIESVLAEFAGCLEALQTGRLPPTLDYVSIVDRDSGRVQRLRQALEDNLAHADYASRVASRWAYRLAVKRWDDTYGEPPRDRSAIERAGTESEAKPHVFVAMPFSKDMDDVFYYGIQQPVRAAGFVCERADQDAFTGDILSRVKERIKTAAAVIADLSKANPNVYLEVGYAWGKDRPTILLVREAQELLFDVRGQRCLIYERIKDLEESLTKELKELKSEGFL